MKYFLKITVLITVCWIYNTLAQGGDICSMSDWSINDAKIGVLYSPNYPNDYPIGQNCTVTLTSQTHLTFVIYDFELENRNQEGNCVDGLSFTANGSTATLCSGGILVLPQQHNPKTNHVVITFYSDSSVNYRGFFLLYRTVESDTYELCKTRVASNGIFGAVTSPSYPKDYPKSATCSFTIIPDSSKILNITTWFMDIKHGDSVEILSNGLLVDNLTSSDSSVPYSVTGENITVTFSSNSDDAVGKGFILTYTSIDPATTTKVKSTVQEKQSTTPTNYITQAKDILTSIVSTVADGYIMQASTTPTNFTTQAKEISTIHRYVSTVADGFLDENSGARKAVDLGPVIGGAIGGIVLLVLIVVLLIFIWRWQSKRKSKSRQSSQNCGFNKSVISTATGNQEGADNVIHGSTVQSLYETTSSNTSEYNNLVNQYTELQTARVENRNTQGNHNSEYQDTELHTTSKEAQNASGNLENQNPELYTIVENQNASENCDYENLQAELCTSHNVEKQNASLNHGYGNRRLRNQSSSESQENYEYPCPAFGMNCARNNEIQYDYIDVHNK